MTSLNHNNSFIGKTYSHYIKLQIQYGSDLYEIILSNKNNKIQVEHILEEIEKLTNVPKYHQTLIYKGQRLDHKPKANLDDLYIFNNSKLILSRMKNICHHKNYCPDRDHNLNMISLSKPTSLEKQIHTNTNIINEQSNKSIISDKNTYNNGLAKGKSSSSSSSLIFTKKQDINSNLNGFVPDANKTYEFYTVPYKTDPTTLLQHIQPSTSNVH